jgi:hypothetical protein
LAGCPPVKYPALILTSLSGNFEASSLDNILNLINGGSLIIGHLAQVDDFSGEMRLVSKMKEIGTDIIARMLHDHQQCELLAIKAIPGFNVNTVIYEMLGPMFDNDYRLLYTFKLIDCLCLEYNSMIWKSIEG